MSRAAKIIVAIVVVLCAAAIGWANRGVVAVLAAPAKKPTSVRAAAAVAADSLFWRTFHSGNYDGIANAVDTLTAAYLATPTDAVTAAHIGWLHNWRIAESAREDVLSASITDETTLARKYFQEAVRLNPADARYLGFLAGQMLAEGTIHQDVRLTRQGYFRLRDAIEAWPEFNLFTGGYIMSRQPADSPRFREGLEWEWKNLDVCIGETINRQNPDYTKYMALLTTEGRKRVCWNSWIAPHNLEGFFLNMGDMLTKSGDWQTAQKIYANARLAADYSSWKYRSVLEDRIRDARANVARFNATTRDHSDAGRIMITSSFACMGCHQR